MIPQITTKELKDMNACTEGIFWWEINKEKTLELMLEKTDRESIKYFNWYVTKKLSNNNCIKYSIFSAKLALENFEKVFPIDDRPRKAIESARNYLNDPSENNKRAARSAYSAARSVYSAAYSATDSVAYSAADSAADSAYSAAYIETMKKIVLYGISLLKEQ